MTATYSPVPSTVTDCSVDTIVTEGAETVSLVVPEIVPRVALMVDVPAPTPLASPAAVIVATFFVAELHVTLPVRICVLLSL
jgi:hypothetical protein